ncbi:MAG TPA: SMP-30/gluconolactonase/LRE family protein [Vicinamibacterales bacterium]|nr:SMP-30/gluconolactonase/LRE family protein [Vicinamibacterales bacterium]
MSPEVILDIRAELGEGPLWDDRRQRLLFVDIMRGHVHDFDPAAGTDRIVGFPWPVGAVALHENGDWVLATATGFHSANPVTGETRLIAAVEADRPANRMNDGYVDARGRFWAGTMNMQRVRHEGTLYRLDADGSVSPMVTDVSTSNGIDWSPDNRTAYYVDTPTGRIDTFDFDVTTGVLGQRRPFAEITSDAGSPDGLIVDAEGFVWVCLWKGGAVRRYSPDGRLDRVITMPVTKVTKCAFGGRDLDELFITTAWRGLTEPEREQQPLAGALFRVRPGVKGKPVNRFAARVS